MQYKVLKKYNIAITDGMHAIEFQLVPQQRWNIHSQNERNVTIYRSKTFLTLTQDEFQLMFKGVNY